MNQSRCKHDDCFTCPYPDCIAGVTHLKGEELPREYDRKKGGYTPKQGYRQPYCYMGLREDH